MQPLKYKNGDEEVTDKMRIIGDKFYLDLQFFDGNLDHNR